MDEQVRWVTKAEAAREFELSLSSLDRKIRRGEIEVRREGRRVYVRLEGPEYVSDDELLRRALDREDKLQRTVWELDGLASELERELDEAREAASASRQAYAEMEEAYRKEIAAHKGTKELLNMARVTTFVLSALLGRERSRVVVCAEVGADRPGFQTSPCFRLIPKAPIALLQSPKLWLPSMGGTSTGIKLLAPM